LRRSALYATRTGDEGNVCVEAYGELAQLDEAHDEFDAVALGEAVDGALLLQLPQLLLKRQLLLCRGVAHFTQSIITGLHQIV
jgi:hypothetical protein